MSRRSRADRAGGPDAAAGEGDENARLRLLEGLIGRTRPEDCAAHALRWLSEVLGVARAICVVQRAGERRLVPIAWHGFTHTRAGAYLLDLDDLNDPLGAVARNQERAFFPRAAGRRRPATPFRDAAFHALPLQAREPTQLVGLLLCEEPRLVPERLGWFADVLGRTLGAVAGQPFIAAVAAGHAGRRPEPEPSPRHAPLLPVDTPGRAVEDSYRRARMAEAQARAEHDRLNLIIDSVADPIVVTDAAGAISLMNHPAERLFRLLPGAPAVQRRAVRSNTAGFSSFIAGMLAGADQRRIGELGLLEPGTGEPMPVEAIAGKVVSERGELTAVVTILHDRREALEKARLYEQLKDASDELERKIHAATADIAQQNELLRRQAVELEQASMLKSQFLANMSHEFRTPLNAILGYTSMLLQGVAGELAPPARRQLGRIESNGRHLLTIINEILDISRIEAGQMPLQLSRINVAQLLQEVRAELEPLILRSRLAVHLDIARNLKPVASDRQKLKQILMNLLGNALKFTHAGSVTIRARQRPRDGALELSVADTGIGIAPHDLERIFEDFRQLDNSPTRAYGGTGLGLAICRRLARMLDGTIAVDSRLGSGSTFTLTLPTRGMR